MDKAVALVAQEQSVPRATAILKQQGLVAAGVSEKTILRAVKRELDCSTVDRTPLLSAASMAKRRAFCQSEHDANCIIAVDSTYFTLGTVQHRRRRWVPKGTRATAGRPNKSQQLHVYGGITAHGKTGLVYVSGTSGQQQTYRHPSGKRKGELMTGVGGEEFRDIMRKKLKPAADQIFADAGVSSSMWLIDNAPCHAAAATLEFFSTSNIQVCNHWPPNSPDLNPIENVWALMKRQVYSKPYSSLAQLKAAVEAAWQGLSNAYLKTLMDSFERRNAKCLELGGGYTGY
jgi:hypothetical protein